MQPVSYVACQDYWQRGFVRIENVFPRDEALNYGQYLKERFAEDLASQPQAVGNNLWVEDERCKAFTFDQRLATIATTLSDAALRIYHDGVIIKGPSADITHFHQGQPNWHHEPRADSNAIILWVALTDCSYRHSCMGFIPGTHRMWNIGTQNYGISRSEEFFKMRPDLAYAEAVFVPLRAGDLVAFHANTAHLASNNQMDSERIIHRVCYMDIDTRYRPLGDGAFVAELAPDLQAGEEFPDAQFPPVPRALPKGRG